MTDLSYKNVISNFFVANKLIATRKERIEKGFQFVLQNIPKRDLSEKLKGIIKSKVSSVEVTFFQKLQQLGSESKEEFERYYDKWIHTDLKFTLMWDVYFNKSNIHVWLPELPPSIMSADNLQRGSTQKKKEFEELSERQKNRRVEELSACEVGQLLLAAAKSAKDSNQSDLHYVLKLLYNDRQKATEIRRLLTEKSKIKLTLN